MLDLSEESLEENLSTCEVYLQKLDALGVALEIELGCTGGEEDGVDNTGIDNSKLYTQPEDVALAYERLGKISDNFQSQQALEMYMEFTSQEMLAYNLKF